MSVPLAVLDTNVLVSGLCSRSSTPRALLERFRNAAFTLAISPALLAEFIDVVTRPSLRRVIAREAIDALLENLREDAVLVEPTERLTVVRADPDDDELFACAVAAGASWIVSGDKTVLAVKRFREIRVVTPTAFLNSLVRSQK